AQRLTLELEAPAGELRVDPTGRFVLELRGSRIYVWSFDRERGTLQPAIGSPLQDEGGPATVVYDALETLAFGSSGALAYVGIERADHSFHVLPFRLDAGDHSVTPVRDG